MNTGKNIHFTTKNVPGVSFCLMRVVYTDDSKLVVFSCHKSELFYLIVNKCQWCDTHGIINIQGVNIIC
nr:MAG TPA: hypothetical protein [Caudoviricetes sp.]